MEKKSGTIDWAQYGFYEYLLMVHPDAAVNEMLLAEKQSFSEKYHLNTAKKTKPHITVANFLAKETMEPTLIRWMERALTEQTRFEVTLNNYSGFPSHTIFWRVQNPAPFFAIGNSLKVIQQYLAMNDCPEIKFIHKPHLTLCRRLPEQVYYYGMLDYSQRIFHESFDVNELVLIKRKHQFDTCQQVNVFALKEPSLQMNEHEDYTFF
jgi:2'-5' RNA ligase